MSGARSFWGNGEKRKKKSEEAIQRFWLVRQACLEQDFFL